MKEIDPVIQALQEEGTFLRSLDAIEESRAQRLRRAPVRAGGKTRIELAGDDSTLSNLSTNIGLALGKCGCYTRADELVVWDKEINGLRCVSADRLRTFAEDHIEFFSYNFKGDKVVTSMNIDMARAVLASPQFHSQLPRIIRVNSCPQPTICENDRIKLLPAGYDRASGTLTVGDITTIEHITREEALQELRQLFSEFEFVEPEQGLAVAVAGKPPFPVPPAMRDWLGL